MLLCCVKSLGVKFRLGELGLAVCKYLGLADVSDVALLCKVDWG
jgi:hypothetical protein